MTPEQIQDLQDKLALAQAAQAPVPAAPVTSAPIGDDWLAHLNKQATASAIQSKTYTLKVEWMKDAMPTKTGLSRKLIKFAEINFPMFILTSAINGSLKDGNSYPVDMVKKGEYLNVSSIKGDRNATFDTFDYLLQRGDNRAAFAMN